MGQVPSRGPIDPNYRLLRGRLRSRSRGSLRSRTSSTAITATSSGPDQVRSFSSADGDSDTIFSRPDREEHRLYDGDWIETSSFHNSALGSPATISTNTLRHALCHGGTRCSHIPASQMSSSRIIDRKPSVPEPHRLEGTQYSHSTNGCCECTGDSGGGDDRPRRSTLPVLSSSTCLASNCPSTTTSSSNSGRSWMRASLSTANEASHRMEYTDHLSRHPRNRLRKMTSLANNLRSFAMGKRTTPSVRSERSMESVASESDDQRSTTATARDPMTSGCVVATANISDFVVSANETDAQCQSTTDMTTMTTVRVNHSKSVEWPSPQHIRSMSATDTTGETSPPFDSVDYTSVRRGSVQETPLCKKHSIIGSLHKQHTKNSNDHQRQQQRSTGIGIDSSAMRSCPLVANVSCDPMLQCTIRQNSLSADGKGDSQRSKPKLNIITESHPVGGTGPKTNSLVQFHWVQGRRRCDFHQGASEMLPGDQDDIDYADHLHDIVWFISRRNYFAPLLYPKRVLDVGCGSGTWMREMAATFPKSQFTGIDLVDVFARDRAPKNCRFQLGNILDGMPTLPANTFDYIHQRMLVFNIPTASYPNLFAEYARLLKSGGFLELMECDMQLQPVGPFGARLNAMLRMVCSSRGIDLDHAASLDEHLASAGLHRVGREVLHIPVGAWAGVTGEIVARVLLGQIFSNFESSFLRFGLLENLPEPIGTDTSATAATAASAASLQSDPLSAYQSLSYDMSASTESWAMLDMTTPSTTCSTSSTADIYAANGLSTMSLLPVSEEFSFNSASSDPSQPAPRCIRWDTESRAANLADLLARFSKEVDDRQTHLHMHVFVAQKKT